MQFEEPKVEFIEFDTEIVTAASNCVDGATGGVLECTGANMTSYCGDAMAKIK